MNSILNSNQLFFANFQLFEKRFPQLAKEIAEKKLFDNEPDNKLNDECFQSEGSQFDCSYGLVLKKAKNGSWTASENGQMLHSLYNPEKEADAIVSTETSQNAETAVFFGFGLGYLPVAFASHYPQKNLVIIEPEISRIIPAFSTVDWKVVFEQNSCIFLAGANEETAASVIERLGIDKCVFFALKPLMVHAKSYFDKINSILEQSQRKDGINNKTLEKFSKRWMRNACHNLPYLLSLDGVNSFAETCKDYSACILAAGPGLDELLPHLAQIKKHAVLICVDTALRACLRNNIQPDFIVLADPQYWNARHLDGLSSPQSILVTEAAAYPSVFRFQCKSIVLFSSRLPLARYIEKRTKILGELGAGGSVATTAWDFARLLGCMDIYMAGLDLGFPDKKTHTKGSLFEERALSSSTYFNPAETASVNALYSAYPYNAKDYLGEPILTDRRMALYQWWFENSIAKEHSNRHTWSLNPHSLAISGIRYNSLDALLNSKEPVALRKLVSEYKPSDIISTQAKDGDLASESEAQEAAGQNSILQNTKKFAIELIDKFSKLEDTVDDGFKTTDTAIRKLGNRQYQSDYAAIYSHAQQKLSKIDSAIKSDEISELAALVFPTQEQLADEFTKAELGSEKNDRLGVLKKSRIIYCELLKSIEMHIAVIKKYCL